MTDTPTPPTPREATMVDRRENGTHWPDCWKVHLDCAVAALTAAEARVAVLEDALRRVTDHLVAVMSGPIMQEAGVVFASGVENIPTIKAALAALAPGTPAEPCDHDWQPSASPIKKYAYVCTRCGERGTPAEGGKS